MLQEAPADSGSREIRQIVSLLDGSAMRLVLTEDGRPVYTFGTEQADDARLLQSAESLDCDPVQVSTGSRGIYLTRLTYQGRTMQLALFGTPGEHTGEEVKAAVALSALLILLAIVLSILATNRFLTRFVLRRVEEPLDLLADGVRRIGEGDLDFRIAYAGKDEFAPVCGAAEGIGGAHPPGRGEPEGAAGGHLPRPALPSDLHPGLCGGPAGRSGPD